MKNLLLLSLLIGLSATAQGQSKIAQPKPDLSKFTSAQLQACYKNGSICGTGDQQAIGGELMTRLPKFSDDELMGCFGNWMICGGEKFGIAEELAHRRH